MISLGSSNSSQHISGHTSLRVCFQLQPWHALLIYFHLIVILSSITLFLSFILLFLLSSSLFQELKMQIVMYVKLTCFFFSFPRLPHSVYSTINRSNFQVFLFASEKCPSQTLCETSRGKYLTRCSTVLHVLTRSGSRPVSLSPICLTDSPSFLFISLFLPLFHRSPPPSLLSVAAPRPRHLSFKRFSLFSRLPGNLRHVWVLLTPRMGRGFELWVG